MTVEELKSALENLGLTWFGENNYIVSEDNSEIYFDCKFPDKIVTNQSNVKHNLYGFILRIKFYKKSDALLFKGFVGNRAKLTKTEAINGYCFSHISTLDSSLFCFGSGPLYTVHEKMISYDYFSDSVENFTKLYDRFFALFNSYLEWESIEGGPYKRIDSLSLNHNRTSYNRDTIRILARTIMAYIKFNDEFKQSFIKSLLKRDNYSFSLPENFIYNNFNLYKDKIANNYLSEVNKFGEQIGIPPRCPDVFYKWGNTTLKSEIIDDYEKKEYERKLPIDTCRNIQQTIEESMNIYFYNEYE